MRDAHENVVVDAELGDLLRAHLERLVGQQVEVAKRLGAHARLRLDDPFLRLAAHRGEQLQVRRRWLRSAVRGVLKTLGSAAPHVESGSVEEDEAGVVEQVGDAFLVLERQLGRNRQVRFRRHQRRMYRRLETRHVPVDDGHDANEHEDVVTIGLERDESAAELLQDRLEGLLGLHPPNPRTSWRMCSACSMYSETRSYECTVTPAGISCSTAITLAKGNPALLPEALFACSTAILLATAK
jgi:hypothetical protein